MIKLHAVKTARHVQQTTGLTNGSIYHSKQYL